ncbi:unnamed protein product [Albugo candida]|uniref:Secreted protein n=3 Tax=Albugo candida TaxID=65357 RepID=A0A024G4K8_9STRA|nr:unnamed protein product [Albugo candida]|eukprot:CCI41467.1 unnamed protein product [Albugo candida]
MQLLPCVAVVMVWSMEYVQIAGNDTEQCIGVCTSEVMKQMEEKCSLWRERLPRPDLFSTCQNGYSSGSKTGCGHYCSGTTDHQELWSARFEYCSYLRNQLPTDLLTSCSSGFTSASEGAHSFTMTNAPIDDDADSKVEDVVVRNTKKANPKSVKHAKSVLIQAREEAQDAYINDKKQESLLLSNSQSAEL